MRAMPSSTSGMGATSAIMTLSGIALYRKRA
jgi:hypothetical protein